MYLRDTAPVPDGLPSRLERRYTTELTEALVLPARRGVQRPAGRLRPTRVAARRLEGSTTSRPRSRHGPGHRHDRARTPSRRRSGRPPTPATAARPCPTDDSGHRTAAPLGRRGTAAPPRARPNRPSTPQSGGPMTTTRPATPHGPAALRGQPVLRRQPHVRGEGPAQQMRFQDLDAVMEVLDAAYDEGVRTFMCTTHDRVAEVCDVVRPNPTRYPDMKFFPCMPYAHKYANAMTEDGFLGAIRRVPARRGPPRQRRSRAPGRWPARTSRASRRCSSTPR